MLEMMYVILFIGCPLFILITTLLTKKNNPMKSLDEKDLPFTDEEAYKAIPKEFREKLRFMVRYSPVKRKLTTRQNYVYLEEQLLYGNIPLTAWIKHDVPLREDVQLSPQALKRISMLKQYTQPTQATKGAPESEPKLQVVAGGRQ
jgi:hypothetical protein